ncbi:MAG: amidohydrolase family protein [Ruminococcus sp.]|jgi:imidazolonepropionase-like amidohydrolase|nr:amidohydrolase family protein [Ruminococcus sp.]
MYDLLVKNARIFTACSEIIECGFLAVKNGKIVSIISSGEEDITESAKTIINAEGKNIYPGLIDAHSHIGLLGSGQGAEGDDLNEDSENAVPHIRAIDGVDTFDEAFAEARGNGITAVLTGSGSANPVGGDIIAVKTAGVIADKMVIKTAGIKFALGENPKNRADTDSAPKTRMGTAAVIRETLFTAKHYLESKQSAEKSGGDFPDFDFKSESLLPLLEGKIAAHFHCHKASDIVTAVRIADEFGLDLVLIHCSEGYKVADFLRGKKAVLGPFFGTKDKPELGGINDKNPSVLEKAGVTVAIASDYPEIPLKMLRMSAAEAVKNGMSKEGALLSLTKNAATLAGIDNRCGSLEAGKDADFIITDGELFDFNTEIITTVINGEIVYERQ